ncbi:MAG: hypothetical protein RDU13_02015 [Elusimicrobiales bacterium]|nr:hypothetical protein [Elusimicrobiales bacterium]
MMKKELGKILRKAPAPRSRGEAAYYLLAPAAFALAQLYYIRSAHIYFYHSLPLPLWAALIPPLPLLALEYAATRLIEGRRLGMTPAVRFGLYARLLFFAALCGLFFFYPAAAQGADSVFLPLVGLWHFVARTVWAASPLPAAAAGAAIAAVYWLLTYRRASFRLTATILLPGLATAGLFSLLYFFPESPLRPHRAPPAVLEKIFPSPGLVPADGEAWPAGAMFPHDVYAAPDDSWAAASFGATFGPKPSPPPTFAWLDLRGGTYRSFREGTQVRRFSSECADRLYFAPWHRAEVLEYRPGAGELRRHPLPPSSAGSPVNELFSVHNACGRVFALNNVNPALFELDGGGRLLRALSLHEAGLLEKGSVVFQLIRNPFRGTLLLAVYGRDPGASDRERMALGWGALPGRRILELDERTFSLVNSAETGYPSMDLALSPDGKRLYAPGVFKYGIYELDAATLAFRRVIPSPSHVRSLKFSPDGKRMYAAAYLDGEIVAYDAVSMARLGSFYATPRPSALAVTEKYLYVAGAGGLFRIPAAELDGALR